MGDTDRRTGTPAAGKNEAEAEIPAEQAAHPTSPAAIPPNHVLMGGQNELSGDPVVGSVVADDWGYVPDIDADVEASEGHVLREDTVI
jgi:hypothetical protein